MNVMANGKWQDSKDWPLKRSFLQHLTSAISLVPFAMLFAVSAQAVTSSPNYWITGYYSDNNSVESISQIPWGDYTHIIDFGAAPGVDGNGDGNGTVENHYLVPSDNYAIVAAAHAAGKKVLVCVKDNDEHLNAFAQATAPSLLPTFVSAIANYVTTYGFDGVDIDWEQNINTSQNIDLISRLRAAMPTKLITMAAGDWSGPVAYPSQANLDQIDVMCYDMALSGPGPNIIWHHAAVLQAGNSSLSSCDWRVRALTSAGVAPSKISVGLPFYGYVWNGGTQPLRSGTMSGTQYYYSAIVANSTWWQPANKQYDSIHKANYLSIPSANQFVTYLDTQAIQDYVAWGMSQGFGGFMAYTLHYEFLSGQSGNAQYPFSTVLFQNVFPTGPTAPTYPVITPAVPPAVNQGAPFQFQADAAGAWSCSGTDASGAVTACRGSIDPRTGLYTAPATVSAQQSYGGFQVLPNNHIFNTRIDSLPVNANSAAWISESGTSSLRYETGFPVNYVNGLTPTQSIGFYYTPGNNGLFQIPAYPGAEIEGGWLTRTNGNIDHHLETIDITNGTFQEMYQYYPPGTNSACPTCASASGIRYSNSTYDLPNAQGGGTDAAGLYLMPLTLHPQELEQAIATGGTITHALRMTLQNGYILGSGASRHIWPATAESFAGGGVIPYGARFRLKASFNTAPFSPIAQILLTQLKQYGIILADGGTGWAVTGPDPGKLPVAYVNAFTEIFNASIAPSNFEAVDESGLMISDTSGKTTRNREIVTFTRASDFATASMDVALTGVTVNVPHDILYMQAGIAPQQLTAFVNGGAHNTVTWSMNPSVGTLSVGGLYTPPATSATIQTTNVTATSTDNASVAAKMTIAIYPNGPIRLIPAQSNLESSFSNSNYTDTHGNLWLNGIGGDGSYGYDNGGTWPNIPDITLYKVPVGGNGGSVDLRFDILVPNGTYQITGKFASQGTAPGNEVFSIEANGVTSVSNLDVYVAAGGQHMPLDEVSTLTVTNGELSYVLRPGPNTSAYNAATISSLQIIPISVASSPCDVNGDGATNVSDVQAEVNQALGISACANDINQDGSCNVIDVQRVVNAALGGPCVVGP